MKLTEANRNERHDGINLIENNDLLLQLLPWIALWAAQACGVLKEGRRKYSQGQSELFDDPLFPPEGLSKQGKGDLPRCAMESGFHECRDYVLFSSHDT